ncbi:hypothetical protein LZ30DRAFT_467537 [Colletotrichum cereale]|nr:hypothetical protein LZ30DRAFT_467537 [Colletotrichum cereale]
MERGDHSQHHETRPHTMARTRRVITQTKCATQHTTAINMKKTASTSLHHPKCYQPLKSEKRFVA